MMQNSFRPSTTTRLTKENLEDETVYKSYPHPENYREGAGDGIPSESNTEVIISALQKLSKKLQQLEHEKEAAELSFKLLVTECNEMKDYLNVKSIEARESAAEKDKYIQSTREDCLALEKGLSEILREVRDVRGARDSVRPFPADRLPPSVSSGTSSNKRSAAITITKVRQPFGPRLKLGTAEVDLGRVPNDESIPVKRRDVIEKPSTKKHVRLNLQQVLPFVPSKVVGPSHSLPANIQTLIASLKRHNPWLCTMADSSDLTVEMILKTKKDLKDVIVSLEYGIECLTLESRELSLVMSSTEKSKKLTALQQRKRELCCHRDGLVKHIHKICQLQNQLQSLLKHFNGQSVSQGSSVAATKAKIPKLTAIVPRQPKKKKIPSAQHPSHFKTRLALSHQQKSSPNQQRNRDWASSTAQPVQSQPATNIKTYRYIQLLQYALKINGLKLNTCTDDR